MGGVPFMLSDKTLNLRDRRGPRRRVSRMMHHALHDNRSNSPPVTQPHLHNFHLVTANIVPITPGFTPYGRFANENSNFFPSPAESHAQRRNIKEAAAEACSEALVAFRLYRLTGIHPCADQNSGAYQGISGHNIR